MVKRRTNIPNKVKQTLREEVGFGCPVKGCANPYLEYHHFDPPVHIKPHNNPDGMIALCAQHHKKADGGAYTDEQLHQLKQDRANAREVRGSLDWLRRDMLSVIGGNFYYDQPVMVMIDGIEVVSLKRDEAGYLRLSLNMLSIYEEDRVIIDHNSWENIGYPRDLRSPPQGRELEISYPCGDRLHLRFIELKDAEHALSRYGFDTLREQDLFHFPITAVEVEMTIAGTKIDFDSKETKFGGFRMQGSLMARNGKAGMALEGTGIQWRQNPDWARAHLAVVEEDENVVHVDFKRV